MGNVLEFPSKPSDDFSYAERALRERYSKFGIPEDVITEALVEYRPIHERLFDAQALQITLPGELTDEQEAAIAESVRSVVLPPLGYAARAIFELIFRQILNARESG